MSFESPAQCTAFEGAVLGLEHFDVFKALCLLLYPTKGTIGVLLYLHACQS